MTPMLRASLACGALLTLASVVRLDRRGTERAEPAVHDHGDAAWRPGAAPARTASPDLSGHWLPNSAGQGVSGRYGVDPAATRQFDPKVTPEERPSFQPWALEKIKSMTPTELELSKSSVNCMPRGVPAIWLQNPYSTMLVHKPNMLVQLYEVLNNFRVIHTDGRPLPEVSRAALPRQQRRAVGGRHAGRRIDRASTSAPTSCRTGGFTATRCAWWNATRGRR